MEKGAEDEEGVQMLEKLGKVVNTILAKYLCITETKYYERI